MKKVILSFFLFFLTVVALAQAPGFQWARAFKGVFGMGSSVAVDASGNVYTTGRFGDSLDFDPGPGTYSLASAGSNEIFVSKLDANGNFVWAKRMGGNLNDVGYSIALDASGNVYSTGMFRGTADFDPGVGTYTLGSAGSDDVYISKLDANGNFVWAKRVGSINADDGVSIKIDASNNVCVTGYFDGVVDFDPGPSTYTLSMKGNGDMFVLKLDASGNFVWAKNIGGNSTWCYPSSLTTDASGNIYTTGLFLDTVDFNPGPGTYTLISEGSQDIFVSKLDASGNFVWAKAMGGISSDYGNSLEVDASGNVYTTGYFYGVSDFDPGPSTYTLNALSSTTDIYVSKLDASGNFVWAKSMGGVSSTGNNALAITLDAAANVYITGFFLGTIDFDPGVSTYTLSSVGEDYYIEKLNSSGNFIWVQQMSGTSIEVGNAITVDAAGSIYTTGQFNGTTDFDPGAGTYTLSPKIGSPANVFVHKLSQAGVGFKDEFFEGSDMYVFPNPSAGIFKIEVSGSYEDLDLEIYNATGALVLKKNLVSGLNTVEFSDRASGLYFAKIRSNNSIVSSQKIVIK